MKETDNRLFKNTAFWLMQFISMKNFYVFVLVAVIALIVTSLLKKQQGSSRTGSYTRRKIMTDNELEFFGRLVAALPDYYVFPQMALSAMLEATSNHARTAHSDRLRIAQQRADYVVCAKNCELVAVVELDDNRRERQRLPRSGRL